MPPVFHLFVIGCFWLIAAPPAGSPSHSDTTQPDPGEADQLRNIREGVVDENARLVDRRRWADHLLTFSTDATRGLVVELLRWPSNGDVQRALCGALANRAGLPAPHLDAAFVDPLIDLLASDVVDLRSLAARALADFPGSDVPARLAELAGQADTPTFQRLAAIDALAPNTHRRTVVAELVGLLDADAQEVADRVVAALSPLTLEDFGNDRLRWQEWWKSKERLTEEVWLAEQFGIYRHRVRSVTAEFRQFRERSERRTGDIANRMRSFQRDLLRENAEQSDTKLAEWLTDPLFEVQMTAFSMIRARMADEGQQPEGEVLVALLAALKQSDARARRAALEIVQNLSDPAVVDAVLAGLTQEKDDATRQAMLKALGKLGAQSAFGAIIAEINAHDSSAGCVREAAVALALVAGPANSPEQIEGAVSALKTRYGSLPAGNASDLRAALLRAMAGVGDASFATEFIEAVELDDPGVLRWSMRGLRVIGDKSKLTRLRTLTEHADSLVRLEAIEAVGTLGGEQADLERLLARLNPSTESNESARDAAWRGFDRFWQGRAVADRVAAAGRLRDIPGLESKYLAELADDLSTQDAGGEDLQLVLDRLCTVLLAEARYSEAVTRLRTLYDMAPPSPDPVGFDRGLQLLSAMLRAAAHDDAATLVGQLANTASDDTSRAKIVTVVASYLDSKPIRADATLTQTVLTSLRGAPASALGPAWTNLLSRIAARSAESQAEKTGETSVPGA